MGYYKLPINFVRIFENNAINFEKYGEKDSIDHNLELIIMTSPGEHKYDHEYGCRIWDLDFERVVSKQTWEEQFVVFISEAIRKYEPRIDEVSVRVNFTDIKREYKLTGATSIRNRVDIFIDARLINTGEKCCFYYSLYLGPLSSE